MPAPDQDYLDKEFIAFTEMGEAGVIYYMNNGTWTHARSAAAKAWVARENHKREAEAASKRDAREERTLDLAQRASDCAEAANLIAESAKKAADKANSIAEESRDAEKAQARRAWEQTLWSAANTVVAAAALIIAMRGCSPK